MSASIFFQKQLEMPETNPLTRERSPQTDYKCWWEHDQELMALEEKFLDKENQGCYCQDEGSIESVYGVCPIHPPKSQSHMRGIVKHFTEEAYEAGRRDMLETFIQFVKGVK